MKTKSFTLIELLVVIVIIGVLAGVITLSVTSNINKAKDAKISSSMLSISKMVKSDLYSSFPIEVAACNLKDSCSTLKAQLDLPSITEDIYYKTSTSGKFFVLYANKPSDSSRSFEISSLDENVKEVPSFDNLVAYYPLAQETANGNTISDMSPNSNNGTNYGATFTKGPDGNMGTAMSFDGDYVDAGNKNFDYNAFTVSLWSKCITNDSSESGFPIHVTNLAGEGNWNDLSFWYLGYYSTGSSPATNLSFGYGVSCCSNAPHYSVDNFNLSEWNHMVGVATETSQTLYLNGVEVSTRSIAHTSVVNSYNLQIARSSYVSRFFKGYIEDVRIYNRALTQEEITLLYEK